MECDVPQCHVAALHRFASRVAVADRFLSRELGQRHRHLQHLVREVLREVVQLLRSSATGGGPPPGRPDATQALLLLQGLAQRPFQGQAPAKRPKLATQRSNPTVHMKTATFASMLLLAL